MDWDINPPKGKYVSCSHSVTVTGDPNRWSSSPFRSHIPIPQRNKIVQVLFWFWRGIMMVRWKKHVLFSISISPKNVPAELVLRPEAAHIRILDKFGNTLVLSAMSIKYGQTYYGRIGRECYVMDVVFEQNHERSLDKSHLLQVRILGRCTKKNIPPEVIGT